MLRIDECLDGLASAADLARLLLLAVSWPLLLVGVLLGVGK